MRAQRTKELIEGYMELHLKGMTPTEIAEHFNVSTWTVYHYLQEIADTHNISRDELLEKVHPPHKTEGRSHKIIVTIDPIKLQNDFVESINKISDVINFIDETIKNLEEEDTNNGETDR